jgi:hypothetical protein
LRLQKLAPPDEFTDAFAPRGRARNHLP